MRVKDIKKKLEDRPVGVIGKRKEFAVLILLAYSDKKDENPEIVFEVRGKTILQPGDICLPGGKIEDGESIIDCALRETEEEIGLSREKIKILGRFDSMLEVNRIRMHTVVGAVKKENLKGLNICEYEVQEVFTVPLSFFKENEPDYFRGNIVQDDTGFPYEKHGIDPDYKWRKAYQDLYFWHYGDKTIWGLTAAIIQWFVSEMMTECDA